jgi:hypothetical protein
MKKLLEAFRGPDENWVKFVLPLLILALTVFAWSNRFIQDDAFVSYRYADHLAQGWGLVWNEGERIEGYTNFLWTVAIAGGIYIGANPILVSHILSLVCFVVSMILTYRSATFLFKSKRLGLLSVLLLGTNYTFSAYATGGLETQLQACLFLGMLYVTLLYVNGRARRLSLLALLSLLMAAGLLTRLDSGLMVVVAGCFVVLTVLNSPQAVGSKLRSVAVLLIPAGVIVGGWLGWKVAYYGNILPNTFYVKGASTFFPSTGVYYVGAFFLSYLLFVFPVLLALSFTRWRQVSWREVHLLLSSVVVWMVYVLAVGGDFMEFRFFVPILPMLIMLVVWIIFRLFSDWRVRVALVAVVLLGSVHHSMTFGKSRFVGWIDSIEQLERNVSAADGNWAQIGKALRRELGKDSDVIIATTAAGAIPYYSKLKTIDMLGLSDAWIARHGEIYTQRPGHRRVASLDYLERRGVNLVIGHPWLVRGADVVEEEIPAAQLKRFHLRVPDLTETPPHWRVLRIPVERDIDLVAFYLVRNPTIDAAIRDNGWKALPIAPIGDHP